MKYSLLFLLLFSFAISHAQLAPFPTPGIEYGSIYVCNPFDCATYMNSSMRYAGDTLLCGETWNKFDLLPYLGNAQYIRAEQGKYYHLWNCNIQRLLYDFSKNVGDTIVTSDLGALTVIEVGIFTFGNGEQRKKMVMQSLQASNPQTYIWVDGIGDIERGFFRPSDFEGGYGQLICLKDSSGLSYHNPSTTFSLDCDSLLCPWPRPLFDYSCAGMTYYFTNLSKESDSYLWDFGDGESSTETHPTHTFASPGCYTVFLKAQSECLPQEYATSKKIAANAPFFWQKSPNAIPEAFRKIQFLDPLRGWALGDQKIWKTMDGGTHWDTVPYPSPIRPLGDLHFKDFEHGIIKIYKPGPPYYYSDILWTNDGTNWETQSIGDSPSITALERINDSVALAAAHYQNLFITKNWGQTWAKIQAPGFVTLIDDFESVGGDTVYFVGISQFSPPNSTTVFGKTTDLLQWSTQEFIGLEYGEQLSFTSAQEGWMSNKSSVYHTTDGGQSWTQQLSAGITELDFVDSLHGWASGYSGIFGTTDGGHTWEEQACVRAGEYMRGLNVFAPNQAYILLEDGLYEYSMVPDTIKLCETIQTLEPISNPESAFSIHPNPSSGELTIQWNRPAPPESWFALFNAQGIEVLRWSSAQTGNVSVAHLPIGLYFLQAYSVKSKWMMPAQKLLIIN
ncbi:MAG: PKD domain-containing protein [Phycisphaerae bacterium]|nr:PKD domain-containing protein [Saprospiraceae bacterium]